MVAMIYVVSYDLPNMMCYVMMYNILYLLLLFIMFFIIYITSCIPIYPLHLVHRRYEHAYPLSLHPVSPTQIACAATDTSDRRERGMLAPHHRCSELAHPFGNICSAFFLFFIIYIKRRYAACYVMLAYDMLRAMLLQLLRNDSNTWCACSPYSLAMIRYP